MTDPRVLRNRDRMRHALQRKLETVPFDQISVREIAKAAGVSYPTFFRHYETKDDLLGDLAIAEVRQLHALTAPVYENQQPYAACVAVCEYVFQRRSLWLALFGGASSFVMSEMLSLSKAMVLREADTRIPPELRLILGITAQIELLRWWLRQERPAAIDEIAKIMEQVVEPGGAFRNTERNG